MDSLLTFQKSTEHFLLRYNGVDAGIADTIAMDMEKNYTRILHDFKLEKIPMVTVRIYPDLESFHKGINFPGAPDQVLATAFGKTIFEWFPQKTLALSVDGDYAAPHEFTHCVHLNVDHSPNNPTWLWEGVAQYEARWFFDPNELENIKKKEFPLLASLDQGMEYMLGFVVIEAIKGLWGFDTVINLIKNQGDVQKVSGIDQRKFEEKIFERERLIFPATRACALISVQRSTLPSQTLRYFSVLKFYLKNVRVNAKHTWSEPYVINPLVRLDHVILLSQ